MTDNPNIPGVTIETVTVVARIQVTEENIADIYLIRNLYPLQYKCRVVRI